jgi:RimJ/RimL family protein N-acetyltransferase
MDSTIILTTERLILRHFAKDDVDDAYRLLYADEEVKRGWSGITGTPEEIKNGFRTRHLNPADKFGMRALCLKEGELIGLMGFQRHEKAEGSEISYLLTASEQNRRVGHIPNHIEAELTYAIGRPYWKQGYASEIGRAMVTYGFETIGIRQIIQGVLAWNETSIKLMQRLDFRTEDGLNGENVVGILDYDDWKAIETRMDNGH